MWVKINSFSHFYVNDTKFWMEKVGTRLKLVSYPMRVGLIYLICFLYLRCEVYILFTKEFRYEDTLLQHTS